MHLKTRNVNTAFKELVTMFKRETDWVPPARLDPIGGGASIHATIVKKPSRNGNVLMIDEPVTITYTHPRERVLFNAARDANPAFHLYEALWMLAGRNDVAPIAYYAKRMREYSDDGKTLNGAYGYRWRHAHYVPVRGGRPAEGEAVRDQLDIIVNHLKADPNSRRAVLQMWNVEDDLLKVSESKDVCCLSWDTKFRSPEGDTNIQELTKRFQNNAEYRFPVYSVDTVTGDQRICWMTNAWKVGIKSVLKITFDDGSSVRMTGDHKVFKKTKTFDGKRCTGVRIEEVQACDLSEGDRVLAELSANSPCRQSSGGYRLFKRNLFRNTGRSNMILEHREYLGMFDPLKKYRGIEGHSVHHKNGNKLDNRLDNLVQLDNYTHFSHDKFGEHNPHNKMSAETKATRGRKHSKSLNARWASMSKELKSALITHKVNRTPERWILVHEHESSKSNHKIVSIESVGTTMVYDFTVPGRHNAVLSNGLVVHNCNLSVMFSLRQVGNQQRITGYSDGTPQDSGSVLPLYTLDMTVTNRSNDMVWGLLGANYVHFTFLQEYMAARLGVEVGVYHHFTNNLHVYDWNWKPEEWLSDDQETLRNRDDCWITTPLVSNPVVFEKELPLFVEAFNGINVPTENWGDWDEPFLRDVAAPMLMAFRCYKLRSAETSMWVERIAADDWKIAARGWIERRLNRKEKIDGGE